MIDITEQDHNEVVAIGVGTEIYFADAAIERAKEVGSVNLIVPRSTFKLMAYLDDSPKWMEYACYPTLFTMQEYNEYCAKNP